MPSPGDAAPRRSDREYPRLLARACALGDRNRRSILELNAVRARSEAALRRAELALRRANARLDLAAERLTAARERSATWRAAVSP